MKLSNSLTLALSLAASLLALPALAGQPVNINSANAAEIAEGLDGVGAAKAQLIVDYRSKHGKFEDPDELVNVKGIGLRTVDRNRDNIKLDESSKDS